MERNYVVVACDCVETGFWSMAVKYEKKFDNGETMLRSKSQRVSLGIWDEVCS